MEKKDRWIALLLVLAVCFAMLFSAYYVLAAANHDCTEDNCPICRQISLCENTLKTLGLEVAASVVAIALTYSVATVLWQPKDNLDQVTLITLKVKLSN